MSHTIISVSVWSIQQTKDVWLSFKWNKSSLRKWLKLLVKRGALVIALECWGRTLSVWAEARYTEGEFNSAPAWTCDFQ